MKGLQNELKDELGLTAKRELRDTEVMHLTVKRPDASGLKTSTTPTARYEWNPGHYAQFNMTVRELAAMLLENYYQVPVIDQTALGDARFDIDLTWNEADRQSLKRVLLDKLGLQLEPGREQIEMLVVEKAN